MADKPGKSQEKPDRNPRKQGRDSRPVQMGGLSGAASEGSQLGNAAAQDIGNTGSSGEGEIQFRNPDLNIRHNPDTEEGLEEQERDLHKDQGHLTEERKRRRMEKRKD